MSWTVSTYLSLLAAVVYGAPTLTTFSPSAGATYEITTSNRYVQNIENKIFQYILVRENCLTYNADETESATCAWPTGGLSHNQNEETFSGYRYDPTKKKCVYGRGTFNQLTTYYFLYLTNCQKSCVKDEVHTHRLVLEGLKATFTPTGSFSPASATDHAIYDEFIDPALVSYAAFDKFTDIETGANAMFAVQFRINSTTLEPIGKAWFVKDGYNECAEVRRV